MYSISFMAGRSRMTIGGWGCTRGGRGNVENTERRKYSSPAPQYERPQQYQSLTPGGGAGPQDEYKFNERV